LTLRTSVAIARPSQKETPNARKEEAEGSLEPTLRSSTYVTGPEEEREAKDHEERTEGHPPEEIFG
jgi:hypothetical protein